MTSYRTPLENAEMAKAYMESYAEKYQLFQGMDVVDYAHLDFISNKWAKWATIYLAYKTLSGEEVMSSSAELKVRIRQLPGATDLPLPTYSRPGDAGVDLYAAVDRPVILYAGARYLLPTGISVAIPDGYEGQVRPRSGLAIKHGIGVLNAPGTIDSGYRGPVMVILVNHGTVAFTIERGAKIAQLVVAPVCRVSWESVDVLDETERSDGGMGSTGT